MARRQRASFGCVQRVAAGKYRLRWMEGGKRRTETLYGTRREADDRMAEIRTRVGSGPSRQPVTVGEAYERWYLPAVEQSAAPNTLANTRSSWRTHVAPRWAAVPLDDVRPADVQVWLLALTRWQAELALRVLRGVYREASIYGLASSDPASVRYRMPDRVEHARARDVIGAADMEAYWEAASSCGLGAMFVLAACCGLRVGESLGPMVGEVEREETEGVTVAAVPVLRQVDKHGRVPVRTVGGVERPRLKTPGSHRWAAVGGKWAGRLLALQDEAAARGDRWLTDNGTGGPVGQAAASKAWGEALEAAGLPRVLPKNLRATFATQMDARDVPVEQIARLMGHASPDITFGVYERPGRDRSVQIAANATPCETLRTI